MMSKTYFPGQHHNAERLQGKASKTMHTSASWLMQTSFIQSETWGKGGGPGGPGGPVSCGRCWRDATADKTSLGDCAGIVIA